jgi:uncharacterized membrane protein
MPTVERSIQVNVSIETAYNQWTQFGTFPVFMEGIKSVEELDERRLHWTAEIGGKVEEWDAEITEMTPNSRIGWRSTSGAPNAGVVTFIYVAPAITHIMLQIEYEPVSTLEYLGTGLGIADRRVEEDLKRFKAYIERQGSSSGGSSRVIPPHHTSQTPDQIQS